MNIPRVIGIVSVLFVACGPAAAAALPTDFETEGSLMNRLYSYFGGVATFSVYQSPTLCFDGQSMGLTIQFQSSFFNIAGVGVGSLGISPPDLTVPSNADTFSLTIKSPDSGQLAFFVTLREDDNNDGVIDIASGDDEWESPTNMIPVGETTTFNIPLSSFMDTGEGSGNGVQNFTTTGAMAFIIDIHSRNIFPGGIITTPKTLYLDHVGLYAGPQVPPPPPPACPGDADGDGVAAFTDVTSVLVNWGASGPPPLAGDADGDGVVAFADVTAVLVNFGAMCR